jgi:hypothetical protein
MSHHRPLRKNNRAIPHIASRPRLPDNLAAVAGRLAPRSAPLARALRLGESATPAPPPPGPSDPAVMAARPPGPGGPGDPVDARTHAVEVSE